MQLSKIVHALSLVTGQTFKISYLVAGSDVDADSAPAALDHIAPKNIFDFGAHSLMLAEACTQLNKKLDETNTELQTWVTDFRKLVNNVYKKLKFVDERGIFEKDDDVGVIFKNIIEIIDLTNKRIQINDDDKQ